MSKFETLTRRLAGERGVSLKDLVKEVWKLPGMNGPGGQRATNADLFNLVLLATLNSLLELGEPDSFNAVRTLGYTGCSWELLPLVPDNLPPQVRESIARLLVRHDLHIGYMLSMAGEGAPEGWGRDMGVSVIEGEYLVTLYRATKVGMVLPVGEGRGNREQGRTKTLARVSPSPGESAPGAAPYIAGASAEQLAALYARAQQASDDLRALDRDFRSLGMHVHAYTAAMASADAQSIAILKPRVKECA